MNSIIEFLCPNVSVEVIVQHSHLVKKYLEESWRNDTNPVVSCAMEMATLVCKVCGNRDIKFSVKTEPGGEIVCLGSEFKGCGSVLGVDNLKPSFDQHHNIVHDGWFTTEEEFRSTLSTDRGALARTNQEVERHVHKFNNDNNSLTTSLLFKNRQRHEVYSMIEEMSDRLCLSSELTREVKSMFNIYRAKMNRIHKMNLVLASLFYLVLNK